MDITDMLDVMALEAVNVGTWAKTIEQKVPEEPSQRQHHSSIVHKASLYIYGGLPGEQAEDHQNEQRTIYRYNTSTKVWSRNVTNFLNNNSFSYIYSHSTAIYNNMMYLFGGKNYKTNEYINGLWYLNLQSFNWKRQELKGYSPLPRQNASMVLHQRTMIVLYGGRYLGNNLNDLHIYKIQNKVWLQIEQSSYDLKICCRLKPALTSQGDYLYLFGGEKMVADEDKTVNLLLDDFYQLKFIYRPMNTKPDVWIKEIITNSKPSKKVGSFINLNEKYLMLWGGENYYNGKITNQLGFWIYSYQDVNWNWIKIKSSIERTPKIGYSINICNEKCYIFGKNRESSELQSHKKIDSGLMILNLDLKEIDLRLSEVKYKPKVSEEGHLHCNQCDQHKKSIIKHKFGDYFILRESLSDRIQYVYSAFGLLVDNSLILKAKQCRIIYHYTNKEKYCLIQDNGSPQTLWDNNNDFMNDLMTFRTYVEENIDQLEEIKEEDISRINFMKEEVHNNPTIVPSINPSTSINPNPTNPIPNSNPATAKETKQQKEQKQKQLKQKQEEKELRRRKQQAKRAHRKRIEDRKQFSRNIKLGSLRIGDRMLYISKFGPNNENRRVFVIQKYQPNKSQEFTYRTYYYILENNSLMDPSMETPKKYIDEEYKMYLKISNQRKDEGSNFLFITNLKEIVNELGQAEPELKESAKHGDIFCCQRKMIQGLQDAAFLESIDISLKSYLTLLYLKCDDMKISMALSDNKLMEINNLQFFEKIDQLAKSERIIDLQVALDLSNCNIIEVYYNKSNSNRSRELNRKVSSNGFLNGVLLYHKNRMICRYKHGLGEVNKIFKNKLKNLQQTLIMFGFIEIKEQFNVNVFKTAFIRDDVLQEIYHRLKFVQKYAERKTKEDKRVRPVQQRMEREQRKKKFKPNEEQKDNQEKGNQVINID